MLDTTTEFGSRVERRLRDDAVIWLTTVRADGLPQPSPVWFLWDGNSFLIFSEPNKPKLRNITAHPKVALNFDGDGHGGDIVVFEGVATIKSDAPSQEETSAYLDKYREAIKRIGKTADTFATAYSVAVSITPSKLRGF